MWTTALGFSLLILSHVCSTLADTLNPWIVPGGTVDPRNYSQNLLWQVGSSVNLQWDTPLAAWNIHLWQQNLQVNADGKEYSAFDLGQIAAGNSTGPGNYTWDISTLGAAANQETSPVFFFWFGRNATYMGNVTRFINFTTDSVASTTSALLATASSTSIATPISVTTAAPSGAHHRANSGAAALRTGLGIGIGLGVALLAALALLWFLMARRKRDRRDHGSGGSDSGHPLAEVQGGHSMPMYKDHATPEMSGEGLPRQELDAQSPARGVKEGSPMERAELEAEAPR
ncbi:hypothetical protein LTR59_006874 [Friedmanniomyces endolithicus]|nr:hypothetical protein LTR94_009326 [Friedmanniomyces endolithicus]KAK0797029.1 hypothetical protein LTR59_006874 [Friedmanniomyces endolithicus]KAK0798045.1 hypothetical protein LTR38_008039 [Friedmanniomyces endolithicus]KAK0813713.1 hypothetical protein LTR75_004526 [Friedmanniomyces endolithicus]KAK0850124.1 hypothetical protein LTR03_004838 [Friedmanniomyces endolithicus]